MRGVRGVPRRADRAPDAWPEAAARGSHDVPLVNRLRHSAYTPPMPESDARHLRGLPTCWEQPIPESALEGLEERAGVLAARLEKAGRKRDADELRRRVAILQRADALHRHASDVETIAGLYRALATFTGEHEPAGEHERMWAQAGVLEDPMSVTHGPAFRETAALRNRAYRWLVAAVAAHARQSS